MLLSLFVYSHKLSPLQWIGVVTVFLGIGVEGREGRKAKMKSQEIERLKKSEGRMDANGNGHGNGNRNGVEKKVQ